MLTEPLVGLSRELFEAHLVVDIVAQNLELLVNHRFAIGGLVRSVASLPLGRVLHRPPLESVLDVFLLFQLDLWICKEFIEIGIYSCLRRFVEPKPPRLLDGMVPAVVLPQVLSLPDHHQSALRAELEGALAHGERQVALGAPEAAAPGFSLVLIGVSLVLIHLSGLNF